MVARCGRIRELSSATRARIYATIQISSLVGVIVGLVTNALDAGASRIEIRLDFSKGYCSVLDNGHGILREDFESQHVARLYYTSKDSDSPPPGLRYGRFLAALSDISLLSIVSCHVSEISVSTAIFKDGERIASEFEADDLYLGDMSHGTRVTVHNLFAKMPVRVKYSRARFESLSEINKEFLELRLHLLGIVLATTHDFSLDVSDETHRYTHRTRSSQERGQTSGDDDLMRIVSALFQAGLVNSLNLADWRQVSLSTTTLFIQASIKLRPVPFKSVQFVSLNNHPVPPEYSAILMDPINALFDASDFGNDEEFSAGENGELRADAVVAAKLRSGKKQTKRWPMLCIHIHIKDDAHLREISFADGDELTLAINATLDTLITEFLHNNGYKCRLRRTLVERSVPISIRHGGSRSDPIMKTWSRVKSGNVIPKDLLSGLPFMQPRKPAAVSDRAQSDKLELVPGDDNEDASIPWTNPRNGNVLHLNSRTGMVVPSITNDTVLNVGPAQNTRKLDDVVASLKTYMSSQYFEPSLRTIGPDDTLKSHHKRGSAASRRAYVPDEADLCNIISPATSDQTYSSIGRRNLKTAFVHGQVDRKFILASITGADTCDNLVMIDQHAADERIRVEELFGQACDAESITLSEPMAITVNQHEAPRLEHQMSYFQAWGIDYRIQGCRLEITKLPETIIERCLTDPDLVVNILRTQIWLDHAPGIRGKGNHWLDRIAACPRGVLDMLISRACRSAIMFNDELTVEQCQDLVRRLSNCSFPFQCAHGRPSLTVLARLQESGRTESIEDKDMSFGEGWKAWIEQSD